MDNSRPKYKKIDRFLGEFWGNIPPMDAYKHWVWACTNVPPLGYATAAFPLNFVKIGGVVSV